MPKCLLYIQGNIQDLYERTGQTLRAMLESNQLKRFCRPLPKPFGQSPKLLMKNMKKRINKILVGIEPTTFSLQNRRSNQMS